MNFSMPGGFEWMVIIAIVLLMGFMSFIGRPV